MEEMHRARSVGRDGELPPLSQDAVSPHLHVLTNPEALNQGLLGFYGGFAT